MVLAETLLHTQRWVKADVNDDTNNNVAMVQTKDVVAQLSSTTTAMTTTTAAAAAVAGETEQSLLRSSSPWVEQTMVSEQDEVQRDTFSTHPSSWDDTTAAQVTRGFDPTEGSSRSSPVDQRRTVPDDEQMTLRAGSDDAVNGARASRTVKGFHEAVHGKKMVMANQIFWFAKRHDMADKLEPKNLLRLFSLCLRRREPFLALPILDQYVQNQNLRPIESEYDRKHYFNLYSRMVDALRFIDPEKHKPWDMEKLVRTVLDRVKSFDYEGKSMCLPALLSSLLDQRLVTLGKLSRVIYEHMLEMRLELAPSYMEHLLSMSKYQRQKDLPFAEVLLSTVLRGHRPHPKIVANVVDNLFPYTNMEDTRMILQALVDLQSPRENGDDDWRSYTLDMSVLETITAAIARTGDKDAIRLVWEYMDVSKIEPSIGIYESTAVAFCHHPDTYANAFAVLEEMQVRGYPQARALVRSMSTFVRLKSSFVETALNIVLADIDVWLATEDEDPNKRPFPLAALNVVLSAAAERGDLDQSVKIMNIVEQSKLPVDSETYCYAFEVLGKHVSFQLKRMRDTRELQAYVVSRAMDYLTVMEERDIALSPHLIREYVEMLCNSGEVETATQVVLDALECGTVSNKTIYRIAMVNANRGSYDMARHLAGKGSEEMSFLLANIAKRERIDKDIAKRKRGNERSGSIAPPPNSTPH